MDSTRHYGCLSGGSNPPGGTKDRIVSGIVPVKPELDTQAVQLSKLTPLASSKILSFILKLSEKTIYL